MSLEVQIVTGLMLVSLLISFGNLNWRIPVVGILNRWLRWVLFSIAVAVFATEFGWSSRPFVMIAVVAFLGWFLLETMYNWFVIGAISKSPIPLFPKFGPNLDGDEWPAQRKFITMRDWLRGQGFKKLQSVKAEFNDALAIRSTIYQEGNGGTRCQILFFPQRAGAVNVAFVLSTNLEDGRRLVTDNIFLPFGGYYPENWELCRKPLMRQVPQLIKQHRRRLHELECKVEAWDEDDNPVDELNRQQQHLEQLNRQQGFLMPTEFQEEHGNLTQEGRYRLWKEVWLLNYLGTTMRG
ncbi:MAG: hypothetical protein AAGF10_05450 [Verrucomicrobiota bacterium]